MNKAYDVYNLDEDLDDILADIASEYEEENSFVKECYDGLASRDGFIDFAKRSDDGLFYSCLFDLVCKRRFAANRMETALEEAERYGIDSHDVIDQFDIETMDDSIDSAIYKNYGLEAKRFLTTEFKKSLGYDEDLIDYEEFGYTSGGRRVLFKGGVPKEQ